MSARILFATLFAVFTTILAGVPVAHGGYLYFTGAQLYAASATGGLSSNVDNSYRHSTNNIETGGASIMGVVAGSTIPNQTPQSRGITFQLLTGVENAFSFNTSDHSSPGDFVGLNLFFSADNQSYNPFNETIAGDLTVEKQLGTIASEFSVPTTTQFVQNYAFPGASTNKHTANGVRFYAVNDLTVQVTSFLASYTPTNGIHGTFTLTIVAMPEPATLGLFGVALISLIGWRRRRPSTDLASVEARLTS